MYYVRFLFLFQVSFLCALFIAVYAGMGLWGR